MKGIFFLIISMLSACAIPGTEPPPYLIKKVSVITGEDQDYLLGAMELMFVNRGEKGIESLNLEFDLYDTTGLAQPQTGQNRVKAHFTESISPGAGITLHVVLDPLFSFPPPSPLTLTRLCITRIGFEDGSTWTDWLRLHLIMGDRVTVTNLREE
jgi:hypothetical protein